MAVGGMTDALIITGDARMTGDLLMERSAVISDCGRYRYRLTRRWGDGYALPWIMLNP